MDLEQLPPNPEAGRGLCCCWIYSLSPGDKGLRKEAPDEAFHAFPSHSILGFFGFTPEKALHSSIDGYQRLGRSCSASKFHLLGFSFFLMH